MKKQYLAIYKGKETLVQELTDKHSEVLVDGHWQTVRVEKVTKIEQHKG